MRFKNYILNEAKLTRGDLDKQEIRYTNFKNKIKNEEPFEGNDGSFYIIDKKFKPPKTPLELPDILPLYSGETVRLSALKKTVEFGSTGGKSDAQSTAQQERASLYAIEQGMSKSFSNFGDFYNKTKNDILKIYPDADERWFNTFYQQQLTVVEKLGKKKFEQYSRDNGFMKWISEKVKSLGIKNKDNWNPADVWLVNGYSDVIQKLSQQNTLEGLNQTLISMFRNKQVIGISLKKMSGKIAEWETVNLGTKSAFGTNYFMKITNARNKFGLKKLKFNSTDSVIEVSTDTGIFGIVQIRDNGGGNKLGNLKFEATAKGAAAARLGKVPLDMLSNLMNKFGLNLDNKHQNYPKTLKEFEGKENGYVNQFNSIKGKGVDVGSVKNSKEFLSNIHQMFVYQPNVAASKLMQLDFLYKITSLDKKTLQSFITDMMFLSQKKGAQFGPFVKLY